MKNNIAVIAGTFDPVTVGHMDIVRRAASLFDTIYVGIFDNAKKATMFDSYVRVSAMKKACEGLTNVKVECATDTTLADFAKSHGASAIIKGIRNGTDADYEISLSQINAEISGIETVMLAASPALSFISSTFVREMIKYGKPYEKYIPDGVDALLKQH